MQAVKKISSKTVMGTVPVPADGVMIPLYRVVGIAHKMRYVETNLGQSIGFKGDWRAVRFLDHEMFEANEAFFPKIITDMLEQAIAASEDEHPQIKCAFDIGIKGDAKSATKYVYTVTPLVKPVETSGMTELLDQTNKMKALPAPTATAKPPVKK